MSLRIPYILVLILISTVTACNGPKEVSGFDEPEEKKEKKYLFKSKYERILLSDDVAFKLEMAKKYYNDEEYTKALPIFEQLLSLLRGTKTEEEIRYFMAYCRYGLGELTYASFLFRRFYTDFPQSQYAQNSMFMVAECLFLGSPKYYLDQSNSEAALKAYRLYINTHPTAEKVPQAYDRIKELNQRLETKLLKSAELYYHIEQYKAAAVTFENVLKDFPASEKSEYIMFHRFKSLYRYASQSAVSKKVERFEEAIEAYEAFNAKYPESQYNTEAMDMLNLSKEFISSTKNP